MIKLLPVISILSLLFISYQCSNTDIVGGSSDHGNAKVIGIISDTLGMGVGNVYIQLFPQNYNPVKEKDQSVPKSTYTDSLGYFHFKDIKKGTYCIKGFLASCSLSCFIDSVSAVDSIMIDTSQAFLAKPGNIEVPINNTVWQGDSRIAVYILGTDIFKVIYLGTNAIRFENIPSGTYSLRAFSYSTSASVLLEEDFNAVFVAPQCNTNLKIRPFPPRGNESAGINSRCKFFTYFDYQSIFPDILVQFLEYRFYWGDRDTSEWAHSISSIHTWKKQGTYSIKVQIRYLVDINNAGNDRYRNLQPFYSRWSEPGVISIRVHQTGDQRGSE